MHKLTSTRHIITKTEVFISEQNKGVKNVSFHPAVLNKSNDSSTVQADALDLGQNVRRENTRPNNNKTYSKAPKDMKGMQVWTAAE